MALQEKCSICRVNFWREILCIKVIYSPFIFHFANKIIGWVSPFSNNRPHKVSCYQDSTQKDNRKKAGWSVLQTCKKDEVSRHLFEVIRSVPFLTDNRKFSLFLRTSPMLTANPCWTPSRVAFWSQILCWWICLWTKTWACFLFDM